MPVLSEQIADVDPSVSTDRSRFTIAPFAASRWVPIDSSIVTTAGRPVGIAEIARLMPIEEQVVEVLAANEAEHDDRTPAPPPAMIVMMIVS